MNGGGGAMDKLDMRSLWGCISKEVDEIVEESAKFELLFVVDLTVSMQ